jgi:hypothetical protein
MTPPDEALDFIVSGSTDPDARPKIAAMNWYGNDAMWVILPPQGEIIGRLFDKIPPYRMKYGTVLWEARRLDGNTLIRPQAMGPAGLGFQAGGPGFPDRGCWEVTYTLDGQDPLRFVLSVH